jgi:hypothetical protein
MAKVETLTRAQKIRVSVMVDTVTISLVCRGDYEAQVLFEDIVQRLKAGEELCIDASDDGQSEDGKNA